MKKTAFYTAIYGNKDTLLSPIGFDDNPNIDYFLFTDDVNYQVYPYKTIYFPCKHKDVSKASKEVKINMINLGYLDKYDFIIWHDANMQVNEIELINLLYSCDKASLSVFRHHRNCIYAEGIACIKVNKDSGFKIFKQLLNYYFRGMPINFGLYSGGILIINNRDPRLKKIMLEWWNEVKRYSRRDQLSLPFILFKNNFKVKKIDENIYENTYINYYQHSYSHYVVDNKKCKKESDIKKKIYIVLIKILRKSFHYKSKFNFL